MDPSGLCLQLSHFLWRSIHTFCLWQTPRKKERIHFVVTMSRILIKSLFTLLKIGEITFFFLQKQRITFSSWKAHMVWWYFSISHSISYIYVAVIKISQPKATYSRKYLFEADGFRGIRVHCSKSQAWWQESKAERSHLSYKHEAASELEMV